MSKVDDGESRRSVSHRVFEPFNFSPDNSVRTPLDLWIWTVKLHLFQTRTITKDRAFYFARNGNHFEIIFES